MQFTHKNIDLTFDRIKSYLKIKQLWKNAYVKRVWLQLSALIHFRECVTGLQYRTKNKLNHFDFRKRQNFCFDTGNTKYKKNSNAKQNITYFALVVPGQRPINILVHS